MLVKFILEVEGDISVVGEAIDGHEAIDAAQTHAPDVVLLDISMPKMDGITALPLIRQASPRSRVVMLTGFSTDEIRQRCADLGAVEFLAKGVIASDIVDAVRRAAALPA